MAWETIRPTPGNQASVPPFVSLACRKVSGKDRRQCLTLSKMLLQELGWKPPMRVDIKLERGAGLLLLSRGDTWALTAKHGCGCLTLPYAMTPTVEPHPAEKQEFRIERGSLVVVLPDWAAPDRVAARKRSEAASIRNAAVAAAKRFDARALAVLNQEHVRKTERATPAAPVRPAAPRPRAAPYTMAAGVADPAAVARERARMSGTGVTPA